MRLMTGVLWVLIAMAVTGFLSTFVIESGYKARIQKVQIVRIDKTAKSALGVVTIDVGEPVSLIVDSPDAFLKNRTPMGLPMLDEAYSGQHPESVIHMEPILTLIAQARIGCTLTSLVALTGLAMLRRFRVTVSPPDGT